MIEVGVVYLVLCEKQYAKRLAFAYLEELHQEFYTQYSKRVSTVTRPYSFIEFGEYPGHALKAVDTIGNYSK